jgi:hypothetical protein
MRHPCRQDPQHCGMQQWVRRPKIYVSKISLYVVDHWTIRNLPANYILYLHGIACFTITVHLPCMHPNDMTLKIIKSRPRFHRFTAIGHSTSVVLRVARSDIVHGLEMTIQVIFGTGPRSLLAIRDRTHECLFMLELMLSVP